MATIETAAQKNAKDWEDAPAAPQSPASETAEPAPAGQEETTDAPRRGRPPRKPGEYSNFFESLAGYNWEKHVLYLYRLQPITDRMAGGEQNKFICKYQMPIDESAIMVEYGSGRYRLMLNEMSHEARSKGGTVAKLEFDIENPAYPPKVPDKEWKDDPRNKRWAWAVEQTQAQAATAAAAAPAQQLDKVWELVMNVVKEVRPRDQQRDQADVTKAIIDAMKTSHQETMSMADPSKMLALVKELVGSMKPQSSEEGGVLKLLMAQMDGLRRELSDARQAEREMIGRLLDQKTEAPKSRLETLREAVEERALLAELAGNGEQGNQGGKRNWMDLIEGVATKAIEVAAPIIPLILAGRSPAGSPQPIQAQPTAQPQPAQPAQIPAAAPASEQENQQLIALLQQFDPMLKDALPFLQDHLQRGLTGLDFGDWFVERYGISTINFIRSLGAEQVFKVLMSHPATGPVLQGVPAAVAQQFVTDFVNWQPDTGADDEPEEPAAAPAVDVTAAPQAPAKKTTTKKGAK